MPCSAMDGTSGSPGMRVCVPTPIARNAPDFKWPCTDGTDRTPVPVSADQVGHHQPDTLVRMCFTSAPPLPPASHRPGEESFRCPRTFDRAVGNSVTRVWHHRQPEQAVTPAGRWSKIDDVFLRGSPDTINGNRIAKGHELSAVPQRDQHIDVQQRAHHYASSSRSLSISSLVTMPPRLANGRNP